MNVTMALMGSALMHPRTSATARRLLQASALAAPTSSAVQLQENRTKVSVNNACVVDHIYFELIL